MNSAEMAETLAHRERQDIDRQPGLARKLRETFGDLNAVRAQQAATQAKMIRACLQRLKSPDSRKRAEGIKGLEELAEMLEKAADA